MSVNTSSKESLKMHLYRFILAISAASVTYPSKFRSYKGPQQLSYDPTIWEAARASLADSKLFPPVTISSGLDQMIFISGELGWKNPGHEVIKEFENCWPGEGVACLASIGTGHEGVISLNISNHKVSLHKVAERILTNGERVAQELEDRFQGRDGYFRLSVEQGLQGDTHETPSVGDVEVHTKAYLGSLNGTSLVDRLVASLCKAMDIPPWTDTREHFEQAIEEYITNCGKRVDNIPVEVERVEPLAEHVISALKAIQVRFFFTFSSHSPYLLLKIY